MYSKMNKVMLVVLVYFLLVFAYGLLFFNQAAIIDSINNGLHKNINDNTQYIIYFVLSFSPQIIGMILAYRNRVTKGWLIIVCYWGLTPFFSDSIELFAILAPTAAAWIFVPNSIYINIMHMGPHFSGAVFNFIISLLFYFFLKYISKKTPDNPE